MNSILIPLGSLNIICFLGPEPTSSDINSILTPGYVFTELEFINWKVMVNLPKRKAYATVT
jgi:hypothetical protein